MCFLATLLAASAKADDLRTTLDQKLKAEIAKLPTGTVCGLLVETETGYTLFANEPDTLLKPASVMKLFTTAAALSHLGSEFQYKTRFLMQDDDLVVVGAGDPALGDPRLAKQRNETVESVFDRVADKLKKAGITKIDKIAIDDGLFDQKYRHEDWPNDQADRWYQAPVGAINFNDNCVTPTIDINNGKPIVMITPKLPLHFISNKLKIAEKGGPRVSRALDDDVFKFAGVLRKRTNMRDVAVRDPSLTFGYALQTALRDRGIETSDTVVRRNLPRQMLPSLRDIHTEFNPLTDVINRCNTNSQNLFAECLLKSLAAYSKTGQPIGTGASWARARDILRTTITGLGVDVRNAIFRDGSGLSHDNRVTPRHIVRLLQAMRNHPHWPLFRDSLSIAGETGTLKRRYNQPAVAGNLIGKTGTISGVRGLAGYIERDNKPALVFALLVNGEPPAGIREKIAEILASTP